MSWILNQSSCMRNQHNFYLRLFFFLLYDSDLLPPLYTDAWSMVVIFALAGEAIQNWRWRGVVDSTGWNPLPSRSVQVNWSCCLWGRGSAVFISWYVLKTGIAHVFVSLGQLWWRMFQNWAEQQPNSDLALQTRRLACNVPWPDTFEVTEGYANKI